MSEVKKIATRDSYGNALASLGREHENLVVLDADLAAATKTGIFKKAFPERHIDCGIAESNMIGVAAGLLGAGRETKDSVIDMSAGIYLKKKIGDTVKKGEPIAICYAGTKEKLNRGMAMFESSIRYSKEAPRIPKLIVDIIR